MDRRDPGRRLLTPEQVQIVELLYRVRVSFGDWPVILRVPAERILLSFRRDQPPAELVDEGLMDPGVIGDDVDDGADP